MCVVEFLVLDQRSMYERMDSPVCWVQARSSSIEAGLLLVPLKFRTKLYASSSQLQMDPEDRLLSQIRATPVSCSWRHCMAVSLFPPCSLTDDRCSLSHALG